MRSAHDRYDATCKLISEDGDVGKIKWEMINLLEECIEQAVQNRKFRAYCTDSCRIFYDACDSLKIFPGSLSVEVKETIYREVAREYEDLGYTIKWEGDGEFTRKFASGFTLSWSNPRAIKANIGSGENGIS